MNNKEKKSLLFIILISTLCSSTILLNIYCMKVLSIRNYIIGDCGLLISWIIFLSLNLITKNFGEKTAINVIKIINFISIIISLINQFIVILPVPLDYQEANNSFSMIFSSSIRIIISSNIAYFLGNITYIKIISHYKDNILSSFLSQIIDNFIFASMAFAPLKISKYEMKFTDILTSTFVGSIVETIIERLILFFIKIYINKKINKYSNK